jgi:hypothetical protein
MRDRESVLAATLRHWRASPFVWGESDCLMSVMTYARDVLGGRDLGAPWRGRYHDEAGAMRLLAEAGGAIALLETALADLERVETPLRGDIVVARMGEAEIGGLWLGTHAAFRLAGRGTTERLGRFVKVVAAWR